MTTYTVLFVPDRVSVDVERGTTILAARQGGVFINSLCGGDGVCGKCKVIVRLGQADKHKLLCESPLDINIAKQVNILVSDIGYPLQDTVIFPTTGALGYGLEYCYSIMERGRTAALGGDKLLQQPVLCSVGYEAWRAKECKASDEELPGMGGAAERGAIWEAITATNLLQAGADILTMRHPKAIEIVKKAIDRLWGEDE